MRRLAALGALLAALLAACASPRPAPTPTPHPALLPATPQPTDQQGAAPTVVVPGAGLPGRLLFASGGNLWLWEGEQGRQITATGDAMQPAWSPDGSLIAYIRRGESASDLVLMLPEGGEPQRLTDNESTQPSESIERVYDSVWAFYPAFAPDGDEIAFASQYGPPFGSPASDYNLGLFTVAPSAGAARVLRYVDEAGHVGRLAYSPDGTSIVFAFGSRDPDAPKLYRYDRAAEAAEPIAGAPAQCYDPAFSPDGRFLAVAVRDEAGTDIVAMPYGGGAAAPVRLTSMGSARAPAFSPDGRLLAFLAIPPGGRGFDLWVVELESGEGGALVPGEPRQITHDMAIDADSGLAWAK